MVCTAPGASSTAKARMLLASSEGVAASILGAQSVSDIRELDAQHRGRSCRIGPHPFETAGMGRRREGENQEGGGKERMAHTW